MAKEPTFETKVMVMSYLRKTSYPRWAAAQKKKKEEQANQKKEGTA